MKESFRGKNFRSESEDLINNCNEVVEEYQGQGLRLTLRQLYYQLVVGNIIANEERSYKNLSTLVSDARLAGLIDWDAIEDRIRVPDVPIEFKDLNDVVDAALYSYRLPRWDGQKNYVELWVEKDALAGVLRTMTKKYHVTLMVNRGYSSQSAMYEASRRFTDQGLGKKMWLLYVGDFDPSGEDMVRDVGDRMGMFGVGGLNVVKVALTPAQIKKYKPPPNPVRRKDPRSKEFMEKHGGSSWEVDALPPNVLHSLIDKMMKQLLDVPKMDAIMEKEKIDKERLKDAAQKIVQGGSDGEAQD